ncbi:peptide chain release factor eRF/aRF, subunit 1 [Vittaforma corneae ATCC 50505]|uniref:Peptide chain release factor eRF/aRF, subunit 1 n=1 Tax=Vittaforma corneae (strain ATCC 50505) TaxID=993615 RepID=L2GN60_VITCO|nr:peptide chain release factor eRF/aRF, subunit 1 [Vittaforma corneae ATCC 50505]ELA42266.1 peptide chain release factor eRF/aRF, subunit 1 [Vittaforma corneae ATCC 50505]
MEADEIEVFKQKKLLKFLRDVRGNGTSMISIIIPPKEQLCRTVQMLTDEYGTATNIKSRVNRLSVLTAISSAQAKLKTISKTPKNGLALYVGEILTQDNKEKKIAYAIEPIKPINTSLYMCDSRFHVEDVLALFEDDTKYGFVVIDGHGAIFATLQGNIQTILQQITVDLPKKHGRGGQSSVRFARLRVEKRQAYVKKVAEICTNVFITNSVSNVEGIILAGHSDLKNELNSIIDQRLAVIKTVDTNYSGKNGLNQAIELCEDVLKDVRFSKEKKVLQKFFDELNLNTGMYCYGFKATIGCLESGAIDTLIVWENLDSEYEDTLFIDWIAENYKNYGCKLVFVSDKSGEGTQFVEGFGGLGGILRYKIDIETFDEEEELSSFSAEDDIF